MTQEELKAAKIKAEVEAENAAKKGTASKKQADATPPVSQDPPAAPQSPPVTPPEAPKPPPLYRSLEEALDRIVTQRLYFDSTVTAGRALRFLLTGIARSGIGQVVDEFGNIEEKSGLNEALVRPLLDILEGPAPEGFKVSMDGSCIGADPSDTVWTKDEAEYLVLGGGTAVITPTGPGKARRPSITIPTGGDKLN